MFWDILELLIGLALVVAGGNYVTDGAEAIARRFRMSGMMVGLTVVALGSSTPDLVVGVLSVVHGKTGLAIGSEVGAVIFDMLLVVGVMAVIRPFAVSRETLGYDFPMAALAALSLFFLADDQFFNHTPNVFGRGDAALMMLLFGFYMVYAIETAKQPGGGAPAGAARTAAASSSDSVKTPVTMLWASAMVVGGLAALVFGGEWTVDGASALARRWGMSEAMIGLTIVGVGSSLPDISTSVMAVLKGQPGIALGNVLGSCVIDILFVLGTCGLIAPLQASDMHTLDFGVLAGASLLIWLFARTAHRVSRAEGIVLIGCYVAYLTLLILQSTGHL